MGESNVWMSVTLRGSPETLGPTVSTGQDACRTILSAKDPIRSLLTPDSAVRSEYDQIDVSFLHDGQELVPNLAFPQHVLVRYGSEISVQSSY